MELTAGSAVGFMCFVTFFVITLFEKRIGGTRHIVFWQTYQKSNDQGETNMMSQQ